MEVCCVARKESETGRNLKKEIDNKTIILETSIFYFQQWINHPDRKSNVNTGLELYFRSNGPNRYIQDTI